MECTNKSQLETEFPLGNLMIGFSIRMLAALAVCSMPYAVCRTRRPEGIAWLLNQVSSCSDVALLNAKLRLVVAPPAPQSAQRVSPAVAALCKLLFCNAIRLRPCLNFTLARQFSGSHYQSACIWHATDRRRCQAAAVAVAVAGAVVVAVVVAVRCQIVVFALDCQIKYLLQIAHGRLTLEASQIIRRAALARGLRINSGSFSARLVGECI